MDEKKIKTSIIESFRYRIVFTEGNYENWNEAIERAPYIPVEYISTSLRYQNGYIRCFYDRVLDLSLIVYDQRGSVCLWPLTLVLNEGEYRLCTNEKEILPPLFVGDVTEKVKNTVIADCLRALLSVKKCLDEDFIDDRLQKDIFIWQTRCSLLSDIKHNGIDYWYIRCKENGAETDVITDLYVDLDLGLDTIH